MSRALLLTAALILTAGTAHAAPPPIVLRFTVPTMQDSVRTVAPFLAYVTRSASDSTMGRPTPESSGAAKVHLWQVRAIGNEAAGLVFLVTRPLLIGEVDVTGKGGQRDSITAPASYQGSIFYVTTDDVRGNTSGRSNPVFVAAVAQ